MAEYSGFFDAQEVTQPDGSKVFDREYFAEHWADYFKLFIGNGVFVSPLNQLKIVAGTGMGVKMLPGWAFIDGYWYHNDSEKIITIPSNASPSDVNYSIHLTLSETADRKITQEQGVATTLSSVQIRLANIKIKPGATAIYDSDITDTRPDENQCGFVKGLVDVIDTNDLFLQFTNMFNTWFDGMKGKLSTDAAGNLQTQINSTNAQVATKANQTSLDATNAIVAQKVDKSEVTNIMTPKGTLSYASLPATGNTVGWYYYCPDGDGTHGAGNYVWNGTSWYFGGTGDEGYNKLNQDLNYTNGFNLLTINTVGNETKIVTYPTIKNRKYIVTNNTTDNITVNLYAAYAKVQTVSASLAPGSSIEFMCNVDNATQIGGWFNHSGTVTVETVTTLKSINSKVDKIEGKVLSTNDYTNTEKNKLSSILMNKNSLNNGIDVSLNGTTNTLATKLDLDNSLNLNAVEATYKDGYYLLQGGSESAESGNMLGTILGVKVGGVLFYTGAGYWSEVCGYYADGTVVKLLDENNVRTNYKIKITDEKIVTVKAWSITATKSLSLKYYSPIFDKAKKPYIIVDVNGNGDFTDIQSAINFANYFYNTKTESVTIYIRNGIYNVEGTNVAPYYAIDKGSNRINLLGESRDGVIIRCVCTSTKQGIALNIGGQCTIENLTIEELAGSGYSAVTYIGTHKNYALHNDTPAQDSTVPYYTTVKNCKLYSECNTPVGAGLQNNQTQRYENVECIYAENAVVKQQGSLYVHAPYSSSFIANGLEVVDCTLVSYNERPALSLGNVSGSQLYSDIPQTYIRNVTASAGTNEVVCDGWNKTIISKGNSNSLLNK